MRIAITYQDGKANLRNANRIRKARERTDTRFPPSLCEYLRLFTFPYSVFPDFMAVAASLVGLCSESRRFVKALPTFILGAFSPITSRHPLFL